MSAVVFAFKTFIVLHIIVGLVGLVTFWVPVIGRKGAEAHRRWGRVFTYCMIAAGTFATCIATCSLIAPLETHSTFPPPFTDEGLVRGIFGWMMIYLAVLTINLAWYGWKCVENKKAHEKNRGFGNLALQALVFLGALNCILQGALLGQPLMMLASIIGFATVATNLRFIFARAPAPNDWLREHLKGLVGAGISVYTAFLALGAVRLVPSLALSPQLWAVPLVGGLTIILYHWRKLPRRPRVAADASVVHGAAS
ncbi:MAG: hypothetical protein MUC96_28120 [Myxococcaceae bacterium]|jgi:hypothetical protein|nr:hypothetical protein [Myxococcaceae bacterium]